MKKNHTNIYEEYCVSNIDLCHNIKCVKKQIQNNIVDNTVVHS